MSKWADLSMRDVAEAKGLVGGPFGSKLVSRDYVDSGVPVIRGRNLGANRFVSFSDCVFVTKEKVERDLRGNLAEPGDLVFTQRGTLGQVAIMSETAPSSVISQSQMRLRVDPAKADPRFVYYWSASPGFRQAISDHAIVAGVPHINLGILGALPLSLPPLSTQRTIACALGTVDDLIENNRRRVEVLEEMARAIYREWFVNFRYPGHEEVPLVDSAFGPIPEGWEIRTLGDVSRNLDRFRKPLSKMQRDQRRGTFPYYGAAKLLDLIDDWIFDGEYLLFAEDGSVETPLGYPVLQMIRGKFWANNHTHILEGADVSTRFLRLAVERVPIRPYVTGAAQPKITQANLKRIPVLVANNRLHESFDNVIDPIFDEVHTINHVTGQLIALRDLLLPKLVSGQIDVSTLDLEPLGSRLGVEAPRTSTSGGSVA